MCSEPAERDVDAAVSALLPVVLDPLQRVEVVAGQPVLPAPVDIRAVNEISRNVQLFRSRFK